MSVFFMGKKEKKNLDPDQNTDPNPGTQKKCGSNADPKP